MAYIVPMHVKPKFTYLLGKILFADGQPNYWIQVALPKLPGHVSGQKYAKM